MLSFARTLQLSALRLAAWQRIYRLRAYWETCEGGLMLITRSQDGHELFELVPWDSIVRAKDADTPLQNAEAYMMTKLRHTGLVPTDPQGDNA